MPCDYSKYPANWKTEIRPRILERARSHCESCGVRNGAMVRRMSGNPAIYRYWAPSEGIWLDGDRRAAAFLDKFEWSDPVKIVLTIAHVDQQISNNEDGNLAAWCQRCHLIFDARARGLVYRALAMVEAAREAGGPDQEMSARITARVQADRLVAASLPAPEKKRGRPRKNRG